MNRHAFSHINQPGSATWNRSTPGRGTTSIGKIDTPIKLTGGTIEPEAPLELCVIDSISQVSAGDWDRCAGENYPLARHAFLSAMEDSQTVGREQGILPRHYLVHDQNGVLVAAVPGSLKYNVKGDTNAEAALAMAAGRNREPFTPKIQFDVPKIPARGPRLLIHPDWPREQLSKLLLHELKQLVSSQISIGSMHINRTTEDMAAWGKEQGYQVSRGVNSYWTNRDFDSYAQYLLSLPKSRRDRMKRERKQFRESGLTAKVLHGEQIRRQDWDAFYDGYERVCRKHKSETMVTRELFPLVSQSMKNSTLLVAAFDGDQLVAGNVCLVGGDTLHSRVWGTTTDQQFVLFELGYHRLIEVAIDLGLKRVDSGSYGKHKARRDYHPEPCYNLHWMRSPTLNRRARQILADSDRYLDTEVFDQET